VPLLPRARRQTVADRAATRPETRPVRARLASSGRNVGSHTAPRRERRRWLESAHGRGRDERPALHGHAPRGPRRRRPPARCLRPQFERRRRAARRHRSARMPRRIRAPARAAARRPRSSSRRRAVPCRLPGSGPAALSPARALHAAPCPPAHLGRPASRRRRPTTVSVPPRHGLRRRAFRRRPCAMISPDCHPCADTMHAGEVAVALDPAVGGIAAHAETSPSMAGRPSAVTGSRAISAAALPVEAIRRDADEVDRQRPRRRGAGRCGRAIEYERHGSLATAAREQRRAAEAISPRGP